ncbi:DciA family protein [Streptomyces sp. NPDC002308]
MTDQQPKAASGADLARQALAGYKATAPRGPVRAVPCRTGRRRDRGPGREPVGIGGLLGSLGTEQGWEISLSAGSITDRWAELAPDLVGRVEPVHFDPERGRLDLRPATHAYAAQLRLLGGQLAKRINDKLGQPTVRTIRVLPVGPIANTPAAAPVRPGVAAPAAPAPVRTRDTACDGYRAALAAIRRPEPSPVDALVAAAIESQARTIAREPEGAFTPAAEARAEEAATNQALRPSEAARRAALAYKRSGATTDTDVRRAFDAA